MTNYILSDHHVQMDKIINTFNVNSMKKGYGNVSERQPNLRAENRTRPPLYVNVSATCGNSRVVAYLFLSTLFKFIGGGSLLVSVKLICKVFC